MMKKHKKDIINFGIIFCISLLICGGFVKMHYTTDTYKIADAGYKYYANNWFLKDARIFSYLLLIIVNILKIPIQITNYISEITSIFISCISVILLKNIITSFKNTESRKQEILVLLVSYLAIFNFMYIETLYFLETMIISSSILLYILACKGLIIKNSHYKIKVLMLVLLGINAYQGTISFFMILAIIILLIKHKKINKNFFIDICLVGSLTLISVIINIIEIKAISYFLNLNQGRLNIGKIYINITNIILNIKIVLIDQCGLCPKYVFLGIILTLVLGSAIYNKKYECKNKDIIINIVFLIISAIVLSFVIFLGTSNSFDCGRMYVGLGALPMFIIIYLYCNTNIFNTKMSTLLIIFIIAYFILNTLNYIFQIKQVENKNKFEKEYCKKIEDYILKENIEIKNAAIIRLNKNRNYIYFDNISLKNKITINEIRGYQSAISGFNINTGKKIIERIPDSKLKEEYYSRIESGEGGINGTYSMIIDNILIMPAFIW